MCGGSHDVLAVAAATVGPAATGAAMVFLFLLPGGCPHGRGTEGYATTISIPAFLPLPRGLPGLGLFDASTPSTHLASEPPMADMIELSSGGEEEVDLAE
jgi:hypothetical protein